MKDIVYASIENTSSNVYILVINNKDTLYLLETPFITIDGQKSSNTTVIRTLDYNHHVITTDIYWHTALMNTISLYETQNNVKVELLK